MAASRPSNRDSLWGMRFRLLPLLLTAAAHSQISVTTTLAQVDAVVTTRDGRPVTDLTRDDFEILEDGKPRDIRSFSFVQIATLQTAQPTNTPVTRTAPAVPTLQRQDVHRTIAIVVDDLKMSVQSLHYTREALQKFIEKQIAPGDLVAIQTTSGITNAFGQFTTDTRQMRAAIGRLRATLTGGGPADSIKAIGGGEGDDPQLQAMTRRRFAVGTLGAVRHIAEGMRHMPGRKSVILFSEGMRMNRDMVREEPPVDVNEVRRVSDSANRASVVIYAVDPRGVVYPGLQAKDDVANLEQGEVRDQVYERLETLRGTQATLRFLAAETGGIAQLNSNDMNDSLTRVLADQSGYYLIGFQPGEDAAQRLQREGKYHRLQVRVKRPGLTVRHRKGFLGETAPPPSPVSPNQRLLAALNSPFAASGLALRVTPGFTLNERNQPIIRALLHISAAGLAFSPPDAKGLRSTTLNVIAVADGESRVSSERTYGIHVPADAAARLAQGGFVQSIELEIKEPGPYQLRVAVVDVGSGNTGSASRFLEIPNLARNTFALSSLTMAAGDLRQSVPSPDDLSPAIRTFSRGRVFSYGLTVFNAPTTNNQPAVQLLPRLIRGDQVVWQGKPIPVVHRPGLDIRRLPAGGVLTLGENTLPGEYLLEVQAVTSSGKPASISQWIDFTLQ